MDYQIAKGVFDILPKDPDEEGKWRDSHLWQYVEWVIRGVAFEYGFREIRTPLFEKTELFQRSIGNTSDIVSKEMYTFQDKGGRSLTLRPEGTAPVMRAFIEKRLDQQFPVQKLFYIMPMFRYERQQAGRYRQHHQFGVEAIGNDSPYQDVEGIDLLYTFLNRLGLKGMTLHLNSIGDQEARNRYRSALKEFLSPLLSQLSEDSQERFTTNPLRILDSKDERDQKALSGAPSILDFLNDDCKEHFSTVCSLLKKMGIEYNINPRLVRGLDYYNKTVFEITANELGAQNSLGGGGRYDGLIKQLGGPDLPAFGFGSGLERVIQTLLAQKAPLPPVPSTLLFMIPMGDQSKERCFELMTQLRRVHIPVEMEYSDRKLKSSLRYADAIGARYICVLGENELASGIVELKEMRTGATEKVPLQDLQKRLQHG